MSNSRWTVPASVHCSSTGTCSVIDAVLFFFFFFFFFRYSVPLSSVPSVFRDMSMPIDQSVHGPSQMDTSVWSHSMRGRKNGKDWGPTYYGIDYSTLSGHVGI